MMCVATGSVEQVRTKELELKQRGYVLVSGPPLAPLQYWRVSGVDKPWPFSLSWNAPTDVDGQGEK